jgi:hypothetical protein
MPNKVFDQNFPGNSTEEPAIMCAFVSGKMEIRLGGVK